ncbi:MAG: hypothetical protein A2359_04370 [Candidatus Moranbacteria bacterium RIFOXYB1_FULL_43_19]|nr:MAG: hypothetical protein A2359_04370 [Candidatus Moranbacteria bacterium RIFOXYB1_FULL_43_19]OGI28736.1 MAG: hypothetical protein A2184_01415 [Candidatus Moranbacteria bacterium RIFOXYA1_FULL_44_7]OGI33113.1 MAG: hypothetical protein A2420_05610 [Candidatus Moranbacteria bacterium RIFOXYC1_FULL_44_13]OGI38649.1 MAG: hypothetical protein A2612_00305 [Candidatus Moranbacteria bacterium RIFOXYD1_FULL_44_12]
MPKFISGPQEEIAYLNNLTPEQLSAWAKRVLADRTTSPILLPGQTEPDEFLMDLGLTPQIGEKIKKTVLGLVSSWENAQGTAYLSELLYQVAMLDMVEAHPFIINWLKNESLKGLPGLPARSFFHEDAHTVCWKTFGHYHQQYPVLQELALRDIADERYLLICYRILREENTDHLIRFFPNFLRICVKKDGPFATFNNEFYDINKDFGPEFFKRFPGEILPRLAKEEKEFFEDVITKVRYELRQN